MWKRLRLAAGVVVSVLQVTVQRMEDLDDTDNSSVDSTIPDRPMPAPKPAACAKVILASHTQRVC